MWNQQESEHERNKELFKLCQLVGLWSCDPWRVVLNVLHCIQLREKCKELQLEADARAEASVPVQV